MSRKKRQGRWDWLKSPLTKRQESPRWVTSQLHNLKQMATTGFISPKALSSFQDETGLADFTWRVYYHRRPQERVLPTTDLMTKAQGYVILMHGWGGSHAIWEDLPALVCQANPRLICFTPDVNGFGGSPFCQAESPPLRLCGPHGTMQAVERWLDLLKIHRSGPQRQIFTFVGHSMSGAALFHKEIRGWEENRYNLLALAPAMLHKDTVKKAFYRTMGRGIGTGLQYKFLDRFKDRLAMPIIEILAANASRFVKKEHARIFERTAKGTLARTFFALGLAAETPPSRDHCNTYVMLGHKDRLVALGPTLNLMEDMGLTSQNIQVMLGDHYFFSISQQSRRLHAFNRTDLLHHILRLHDKRL